MFAELFRSILKDVLSEAASTAVNGLVSYGGQKTTGGHDHRANRGDDRTPAQKNGDKDRRGPRSSEQA
jgi:hypothetical protein